MTDLRRRLFRLTGSGLSCLDPRLRKSNLSGVRRSTWFKDQYQNPHESKHTVSELLKWLKHADLQFIKSIPKTRILSHFSENEELFQEEAAGRGPELLLSELSLAVRGDSEGGFFTIIAKKNQ